jgi:hypothetical protein
MRTALGSRVAQHTVREGHRRDLPNIFGSTQLHSFAPYVSRLRAPVLFGAGEREARRAQRREQGPRPSTSEHRGLAASPRRTRDVRTASEFIVIHLRTLACSPCKDFCPAGLLGRLGSGRGGLGKVTLALRLRRLTARQFHDRPTVKHERTAQLTRQMHDLI